MGLFRNTFVLGILGGCSLAFLATGSVAQAQEDQDYFIPRLKPAAGPGGQGIYSKPFLYGAEGKARKAGYFDLEYIHREGQHADSRLHRLVPFIYANVTDKLSFATEVEFEDGGDAVEVEFAFLDLALNEHRSLRVGAILTPLGRLNLTHDSPIVDTTDRPLMHTRVVPTTLRESGLGLVSNWASQWTTFKVGSEIYLTQGFHGGSETAPLITPSNGFKNARPHEDTASAGPFKDNNSNLALAWRVSISPDVRTELGFSGHAGTWDDESRNGYSIWATDFVFRFGLGGRLELKGEAATAFLDRTAVAEAARVPGRLAGGYAQVSYRLYFGWLKGLGGDADAHLKLVLQYGTETIDDPFASQDRERTRWTYGINYRPNLAFTVFKFERQLNSEGGSLAETDDDAWLFSVATYF